VISSAELPLSEDENKKSLWFINCIG